MTSSAWRHAIDKHALTIRELAELLRRDWKRVYSGSWHGTVAERVVTIERLATQILDKPITPPLSTEKGVEVVSLSALVGERARQLWHNDPRRRTTLKLDLQLPENATVCLSPEWLRWAIDILVDNAGDAVQDSDVCEITIGTRAGGGRVEILVSDTGNGISEEIQARIGPEPIEKPIDARGLGMGLQMAYAGERKLMRFRWTLLMAGLIQLLSLSFLLSYFNVQHHYQDLGQHEGVSVALSSVGYLSTVDLEELWITAINERAEAAIISVALAHSGTSLCLAGEGDGHSVDSKALPSQGRATDKMMVQFPLCIQELSLKSSPGQEASFDVRVQIDDLATEELGSFFFPIIPVPMSRR